MGVRRREGARGVRGHCWCEPRTRGQRCGRGVRRGAVAPGVARARLSTGRPRPALREVQGPAPGRMGEPSGESEVAPPERLRRHDSLAEPEARRPAGEVVRDHLHREPRRVRVKRPEGRWFSPTPYLRSRIAFSISA